MKELENKLWTMNDEWWHRSTVETMIEASKKMAMHGVPKEEIFDIIKDIYDAVANEYGD